MESLAGHFLDGIGVATQILNLLGESVILFLQLAYLIRQLLYLLSLPLTSDVPGFPDDFIYQKRQYDEGENCYPVEALFSPSALHA